MDSALVAGEQGEAIAGSRCSTSLSGVAWTPFRQVSFARREIGTMFNSDFTGRSVTERLRDLQVGSAATSRAPTSRQLVRWGAALGAHGRSP